MYVPFAPRNYLHSNALKFQAKDSSDIGNLFKSISNLVEKDSCSLPDWTQHLPTTVLENKVSSSDDVKSLLQHFMLPKAIDKCNLEFPNEGLGFDDYLQNISLDKSTCVPYDLAPISKSASHPMSTSHIISRFSTATYSSGT